MTPTPEVRQVPNDTEERIDVKDIKDSKEISDLQLKQIADGIVNNPDNQKQVKIFPDLWNSLNAEEKAKVAGQLTTEIQDAITELKDLGIEYSPEVSQEDVDNVAALEFVRANKDKIPQSWIKVEEKANEVSKEIGKEIQDKGIIEK